MQRALPRFVLLLLVMVLASGAVFAGGPWYVDYQYAIKSIDRGDHTAAESTLRGLIQRMVLPKERARTYGVWRVDYTPYYFLGVSLAEQGRLDEALKSFEVGVKFGVVSRDPEKMAIIDEYRRQRGSVTAAVDNIGS